jgi:hypothetical protein
MIRHTAKKNSLWMLAAGLGASLVPAFSFGLGLGDIQIESRLNERLHARIEIVDVSDEEWRQIRARIASRTLLSEAAAHPEILGALTLRAVETASHGHFIEIESADPVTEPLFDLPVEVAGQSLQVVRNYSVLLDPASAAAAPRSSPAPALVMSGDNVPTRPTNTAVPGEMHRSEAGVASRQAVRVVRAQTPVVRHHRHRRHVGRTHSNVPRKVAGITNTANTSAAAPVATGAARSAAQEQLEVQLTSLQQTLTQLQATIAAQDAQIARLTAQVAARNESQALRATQSQVESAATAAEVADEDASDERPGWFHRWHGVFYWAAGVGVALVILTMGAIAFVRRRNEQAWREVSPKYPQKSDTARKEAAPQEPRSNPLAWQTSLRTAQSGMWQAPARLDSDSGTTSETPPPQQASAPTDAETVATTVAVEELTQDLGAEMQALIASYESEIQQSASAGVDAWRTQNAMLERDYLADTEALPFVLDPGNQARAVETGRNAPVTGQPASEMGHTGETAVARLAPGLQRTLHDGKQDADSDDLAEVAIADH